MFDVPEIDQQHLQLVSMFKRLNDAVKNNEPRENIYQMIDEVISFSSLHFATEERLMAKFGYPETEAHKKKHRQMIADAQHFRSKLDYLGEQPFLDWFNHWPFTNILAHIQYADTQMKEHIVQGGKK